MSDRTDPYPPHWPLEPLKHPLRASLQVPGSKSITNRALVLAALAGEGDGCRLHHVLRSEDTEVMIEALRTLGFRITLAESQGSWQAHVTRPPGAPLIPATQADLYVANSGTTMRFLTAFLALGQGRFRLNGVPRMRERPIEDLLKALRQLGVQASSEQGTGCPPVLLDAQGLPGGHVAIRGDVSSQFLSGLLLAAPLARAEMSIQVDGTLVSQPYVAMTTAMMRHFGATVLEEPGGIFRIPGGQTYRCAEYSIEPDASAASYFFAAAAITGGEVTVRGLTSTSLQGDLRFVDILERMGCEVISRPDGTTVRGGPLRGVDVDMNAISDTVMTLGAVALFAKGPTTIRNVAHIRHKETDRLTALATELRKLGADVTEFAEGLQITPRPLHGAAIATYNDHRMAMSLALVGLAIPGVVILDPSCVAKTYPDFFQDLDRLRG